MTFPLLSLHPYVSVLFICIGGESKKTELQIHFRVHEVEVPMKHESRSTDQGNVFVFGIQGKGTDYRYRLGNNLHIVRSHISGE